MNTGSQLSVVLGKSMVAKSFTVTWPNAKLVHAFSTACRMKKAIVLLSSVAPEANRVMRLPSALGGVRVRDTDSSKREGDGSVVEVRAISKLPLPVSFQAATSAAVHRVSTLNERGRMAGAAAGAVGWVTARTWSPVTGALSYRRSAPTRSRKYSRSFNCSASQNGCAVPRPLPPEVV